MNSTFLSRVFVVLIAREMRETLADVEREIDDHAIGVAFHLYQ
jgi:hypothetical protein